MSLSVDKYTKKKKVEEASEAGSSANDTPTGEMGIEHCVDMFNGLLADLKVYEQNLQGLHWVITGPNFFALHTLYGDMYDAVGVEVDVLAEKIRAMGGMPVHCFSCFEKKAEMEAIVGEQGDVAGVIKILKCIDYLIEKETGMAVMLEKHTDMGKPEFVYGGVDMLGAMLSCLEKSRWQLSMFLGTEVKVEKGE